MPFGPLTEPWSRYATPASVLAPRASPWAPTRRSGCRSAFVSAAARAAPNWSEAPSPVAGLWRILEDLHQAGSGTRSDAFARGSDNQVGELISVDIAGSQRIAKSVARYCLSGHACRILVPCSGRSDKASEPTSHDRDCASIPNSSEVIERDTDDQFVKAVVVEVGGCHRHAISVAFLRHAAKHVKGQLKLNVGGQWN